jgi:hypothetical protein
MCSILCWILSIWEALGWILAFLAWFMHCQQWGEVWAWNGLQHAFRRFPSGFELFLSSCSFSGGIGLTSVGHRSDQCSSQVLGDLVHRSDRWGWPVWPWELSWCSCSVSWGGSHAFVQGELHWFRGSLHVCRGSSLWFSSFGLVVCALCLSIVLSRMCRAVALA